MNSTIHFFCKKMKLIIILFGLLFVIIGSEKSRVSAECCGFGRRIEYKCTGSSTETVNFFSKLDCYSTICLDGRIKVGRFCTSGNCNIFGCACDGACYSNDSNSWDRAKQLFKMNRRN